MIDDYGVRAGEADQPLLRYLAEALDDSEANVEVRIDQDQFELPPSVRAALARVTGYLANAGFVAIQPVDDLLTTQGAAELLGVSRPYLIKHLLGEEKGKIPFHYVPGSSHRRIRLLDVLNFRDKTVAEGVAIGRDVLKKNREALREKAKAAAAAAQAGREPVH